VKRSVFVSAFLSAEFQNDLVEILQRHRGCFAWDYYEMPGLSRDMVEYRLPIKLSWRPHKWPPRRFALEVYAKIKEEIERLLKAGFIETSWCVK